jgi:ubiquitin C-terminal hydrolase
MKELTAFMVENALSTCYIDSLLMALFYPLSTTLVEDLLMKDGGSHDSIYLQEFILQHFVLPVRQNNSVLQEQMEMIRSLCVQAGWIPRATTENQQDLIFEQQDVSEFYSFLMEKLPGTPIQIQRQTITEGLPDSNDTGEIEKIPFIPLCTPIGVDTVRVSAMLQNWMEDNHSTVTRSVFTKDGTKKEMVSGLNTYYIVNIPSILALGINRFKHPDCRDYVSVIIEKYISPFKNSSIIPDLHKYAFQAAICHTGDTPKAGHYYAIISDDDHYLLFDDQMPPPSMVEIFLKGPLINKDIVERIKKEVVFIIYRYEG